MRRLDADAQPPDMRMLTFDVTAFGSVACTGVIADRDFVSQAATMLAGNSEALELLDQLTGWGNLIKQFNDIWVKILPEDWTMEVVQPFYKVSKIKDWRHTFAYGGVPISTIDDENDPPVAAYVHMEKACVRGHNLANYDGKSRDECALLCDERSDCVAFEYGTEYGGKPYKPGVCILNDADTMTGCSGQAVNLDLYMKGNAPGYARKAEACVRGKNIKKYPGRTRAQCAVLCDAEPACLAFEYGVSYGGSPYVAGDCILNNAVESDGCPGRQVNLDLYTKSQVAGYTLKAEFCVRGHNLARYEDKARAECASLCDSSSECLAFEYGMNYGGRPYGPGTCILNDAAEPYMDCPGRSVNLDLYQKVKPVSYRLRRDGSACNANNVITDASECLSAAQAFGLGGAQSVPGEMSDAAYPGGCLNLGANEIYLNREWSSTATADNAQPICKDPPAKLYEEGGGMALAMAGFPHTAIVGAAVFSALSLAMFCVRRFPRQQPSALAAEASAEWAAEGALE